MPPRKSNVSQVSEDGAASTSKEGLGVEDLALPRTMVQRLAKGVLPPNTQIQKDALLAISKSATVFVNYLTSHANEQAQRMNKKTIQPKDVLDAVVDIEFPFFLERLNAELAKYNAVQCDKRNSYRRKVREEQKTKATQEGASATEGADVAISAETAAAGAAVGAAAVVGTNGVPVITSPKRDGDEEPRAKKIRGEDGMEVDEEEDAPDEPEAEDEQEEEPEEEEDDEDEEEGSDTFEDAKEQLAEDPLEEKETQDEEMEDEALDEGNESD